MLIKAHFNKTYNKLKPGKKYSILSCSNKEPNTLCTVLHKFSAINLQL